MPLVNDYRTAMRSLGQSIGIITASEGGKWFGMTASSITSVSMDPPSLLVCINTAASIHAVIGRVGAFSVSFLAAGQETVSHVFSSSMPNEERFAHGEWEADCGRPPRLRGSVAAISCRLEKSINFATHTIYLGEVIDVSEAGKQAPLIYQQGRYLSCVSATA